MNVLSVRLSATARYHAWLLVYVHQHVMSNVSTTTVVTHANAPRDIKSALMASVVRMQMNATLEPTTVSTARLVLTWSVHSNAHALKGGKATQPLHAMSVSLVSMTVIVMLPVLMKQKVSAVNATSVIPMLLKTPTEPIVNKMVTGHHFV